MPSLIEIRNKIKDLAQRLAFELNQLYLILLIVVVGALSFGLGYLAALEQNKVPVRIENVDFNLETPLTTGENGQNQTANAGQALNNFTADESNKGQYVGSKNSNKYHLPWCSGAARIKEENKVWFASKEEAVAKGYTPASNCPEI